MRIFRYRAGLSLKLPNTKRVVELPPYYNKNRLMPLDSEYRELYELFAEEAKETLTNLEEALLKLERGFRRGEQLNLGKLSDLLRPLHTLKGNAGMIGFSLFSKVIHHLESEIKQSKVLDLKELEIRLEILEGLKSGIKEFREGKEPQGFLRFLECLEGKEGGTPKDIAKAPLPRKRKTREAKPHVGSTLSPLTSLKKGEASSPSTPPIAHESDLSGRGEEEGFIRVRGQRLDELQADVGELILSYRALADYLLGVVLKESDPGTLRPIQEHLERLDGKLRLVRAHTVSLRLTPLTQILRRVPIIVRDASRRSGKEVEAFVEGENTEADKSIGEMIEEVLVHLIRNAVDHGIETPRERQAMGKPPVGSVRVWAKSRGDEIEIGVADDGSGISLERVKRRVVELGLKSEEEVSRAEEQEVLSWLFLPGFSTRPEATELSGRGVGLDVVSHRVRNLGGRVEVRTQEGSGTSFIMYIPVSTRLGDLVLGQVYRICIAFPLHRVIEIARFDPARLRISGGVEQYLFREEWILLFDLARRLFEVEEERRYLLVLNSQPPLAIPLNGLRGKSQGVLRTLEEPLLKTGPFYAVTVLGNGELAPVVDPEAVWEYYRSAKV